MPSLSSREPASFTMESALSCQYSRFDPPFYHQGADVADLYFLPPHDLVMARFFLPRPAIASFPTIHFVALRPLFLFGRPSLFRFSAEACTILQALRWSRQHPQLCHFSSLLLLRSDSRSVLATTLLRLSFYLKLSGKSFRVFPPVLSGCNDLAMSLDTHFFRGTMPLMSWPDGERYLCPLQSLLPLVSTLLFSQRRTVPPKFLDTP